MTKSPVERHFPNKLSDWEAPPGPATGAGAAAHFPAAAAVEAVPRATLRSLFDETLQAVKDHQSSGPTVYTGTAGIAFALWHSRRSLLRDSSEFRPSPSSASASTPTPSASASSTSSTLPAVLLESALEHARTATHGLSRKGLAHGSRSASMLDGAAGIYMTLALVLHDAMQEAAARETGAGAGVGTGAHGPGEGQAGAHGRGGGAAGGGGARGGGGGGAKALERERDDAVRSFLDAYPEAMDSENDEFLYGRAGYLQGAQLLNLVIGPGTVAPEVVEGVATEILESGKEMAGRLRWQRQDTPAPPLFFMWPQREKGEPYLGAAHGMMGILFALLHVPAVVAEEGELLRACLAFVATHELDAPGCPGRGGHYPTRMAVTAQELAASRAAPDAEGGGGGKVLVHWCHGAPGAVFLWCKAHEVFGDPAYLAAAERSGEVVWALGLLRKGHGLCHGTSGNAYALLALHRATGHPHWLARARQFAAHVGSPEGRSVYDQPDRPLSLFEGRGGALCLLADLLADDGGAAHARFPAFELPPH
ncbi:hypothetical protein HYH03_003603 [Edaphochlamys debaryana]|uniref:Uncharacterized protein n=1 Tax=Edaphochlamys debaryana TaxID=47281 RepID=A0A835YAX0_9CHLO|nr:hypothetical protein HYH03_003603 [Edaphochlamys debaryana]|eukprot:KAG2498344.1 hypothetical protein HYH03_003603 [Edaphochlamys debaryana]